MSSQCLERSRSDKQRDLNVDIGELHLPTAADAQAWAQGSCAALPWAADPALECCGAAKLGLKPGEDKP